MFKILAEQYVNSVQTGDKSNIPLVITLIISGILCIVIAAFGVVSKKSRYEEDEEMSNESDINSKNESVTKDVKDSINEEDETKEN